MTEREAQGAEKGSAVRNGRAYCYGRAVNRVAPDESRKERNDGIAIVTKSIASCVPAHRALPNGRRGKHVRKGDMRLEEFAHNQ